MERYPGKFHNPILSTGILIAVLIFLASAFSGCAGRPSRVVNSPLTAEEMAFPPGRYQNGIDMFHRCWVDLESPSSEPQLTWCITPDVSIDATDIMVDGSGGIWYTDGLEDSISNNKVYRINPDGSEDWTLRIGSNRLGGHTTVSPVIACDDAVILQVCELPGLSYLVCVDSSRNIRWRTEPIEKSYTLDGVWRTSDDRLIMVVQNNLLNIYSIADGSLLQSLDVQLYPLTRHVTPLPLTDGGWIINGINNSEANSFACITRLNADGSTRWSLNYGQYSSVTPVTLSENGMILRGYTAGFHVIDVESAEVVLEKYNANNYVAGLTRDGNYIVTGCDNSDDDSNIRVISPSGTVLWSHEAYSRGANNTIVYNDGSILFGYEWGICLIEPDGRIRWAIELTDLGLSGRDSINDWRLNPTPEGNLAIIGHDSSDKYRAVIFYLEQQ